MPTTLAILHADLERTPLGTRSRLCDDLAGAPVLRRTAERVCRAKRLSACVVLIPEAQAARGEAVLRGTPALVRRVNAPPPAWLELVRTARKWSLNGWRGGIGGTTSLDEYLHPHLVQGALELHPADRVMVFPPAAPLLDPVLIDAMIEHHDKAEDEARMTFAQAPPGSTGAIYNVDLLREIAAKGIPPGWIFSYKPDAPRRDMALFACCFDVRAPLRHGARRLIADTDRACATVRAMWDADPADAAALGRRLLQYERSHVADLPEEVEIELTTDDPFPHAVLRPRGARVGARGPMALETVKALGEALGRWDDSLVVLGGFGEPLRHPKFAEVLRLLRESGVYGLAVRTCGVDWDDATLSALIDHHVDVITVQMDGWTETLYRDMHAPGDAPASLERVRLNIEKLEQLKQARKSVAPVIVPEMVKGRPTVGEMPEFFDGWIRKLGTANIVGYSRRAGQMEPAPFVMSMAPPERSPCRRVASRCLVLADGVVVACDQDFRGVHPVGRLPGQTLDAVWKGAPLSRLRNAHDTASWGEGMRLCADCDEWHRP